MKIYLLYYDEADAFSRESWTTDYTACEAFSTPELREDRIKYIDEVQKAADQEGFLDYERVDLDLDPAVDNELINFDFT